MYPTSHQPKQIEESIGAFGVIYCTWKYIFSCGSNQATSVFWQPKFWQGKEKFNWTMLEADLNVK